MYEFLEYRVQDVMSRPISVAPDATLGQAEELLEERGFNGVPVVDDTGRLAGWVTSLDLLKAFDFPEDVILPAFSEVMKRPVTEVMQRDILSVCPRTPLTRVVAKLVAGRIRSFPVLDDERLVGVIARHDVMGALRRATRGERP